jgi:primosomal protein N' (replication factor Y) (superfamily II helicase)
VPPPIAQVEPLTTARALRGPFDYERPEGVGVGSVLVVPFGRREVVGVVTGLAEASEHEVVAPRRVLEAALPPDLVDLALWIAREYASTPARALSLLLPPKGTRAKTALYAVVARSASEGERLTAAQRALLDSLPRFCGGDTAALRRLEARGLVAIESRVVRRAPVHVRVGARRERPPLTADQEAALLAIRAAAPGEGLLLHGVTGSGKTEVYLQAAAETLDGGRTVIVLVPEIALTPQIVARFVERFGDTVAVLHSKLSDGERHDEWARLRRGEARICVGPRSAVFAPLSDVGLIVVDEEHDPSYKHEGDPRYDARRVAMRRARVSGAVLVAGSATPRPESVHALPRLRLPSRVDGRALPPVEVVDMREAKRALHARTHDALAAARKAIVLLNRRGWSNFLSCRSCGRAWECPSCDVTLVMHRAEALLACHHCGHREGVPSRCPDCGSVSIARHGTGTERLSDELAVGLPVFRLDGDVGAPAEVLAAFEAAPRGVLVGTQMVAKGHDFPDVDLGVVVDADATLRFPDFRAEERTFALVTQLAGRAGRGSAGGRVLVQTLAPDARSIALAAEHDADAFVAGELEWRRALRYPPFSTLVRIVCSAAVGDGGRGASGAGRGARARPGAGPVAGAGTGAGAAQAAAAAVRARLDGAAGAALGPAPLFRLRGRERSQVVVKATDRRAAVAAIDAAVQAVAADRASRGVSFSVDVDPQ